MSVLWFRTQHRRKVRGRAGTAVFHRLNLDPLESRSAFRKLNSRLVPRSSKYSYCVGSPRPVSLRGKSGWSSVSAEQQTRTYMVRITVPNPKAVLLVGMSAEARILAMKPVMSDAPGQALVAIRKVRRRSSCTFQTERVYAKR